MNKKKIGQLIKDRRTKLKITQQTLSEITDISTPIISALENGTSNISLDNLLEIVDVVGLEISLEIKEL